MNFNYFCQFKMPRDETWRYDVIIDGQKDFSLFLSLAKHQHSFKNVLFLELIVE